MKTVKEDLYYAQWCYVLVLLRLQCIYFDFKKGVRNGFNIYRGTEKRD